MQTVSTDLHCLLEGTALPTLTEALQQRLPEVDIAVQRAEIQVMNFSCEPDNMLVNQYTNDHGGLPPTLELCRVLVQARTALELAEVTQRVVAVLDTKGHGTELYWYGTTTVGVRDTTADAACLLPPQA